MSATALHLIVLLAAWIGHAAQPSLSRYDEAVAGRLVNYAGASYCSGQEKVANWNCMACENVPGFRNITSVHDPRTDGRAIVGYDAELGARVVAFMGTNINIKTWIHDLLVMKTPFPLPYCDNCTVHRGFHKTYEGLRDRIYAILQALPPGRIYITGHSLGGALATLCALDLVASRGQDASKIGVITMGQPRVGNVDFATFYDRQGISHYRVTHHRDPIPHLPYRWMDYSHITEEVFYTNSKKSGPTQICTGQEDPACSDQFRGNLFYIQDHWVYLNFSFVWGIYDCTFKHNVVVV
jgi:hypothetical protein